MLIYVDLLGFKNQVKAVPLEEAVRMLKVLLFGLYSGAARDAVSSGTPIEEIASLPLFNSEDTDFGFVVDALRKRTALSALLMSDSLVVYSDPFIPEDPGFSQNLTSLVRLARILMLKLFEFQLPARGAISFGEFFADQRNSIFCGKALVEAYEVAEAQEWIGMSICDSLEGHMDALLASFSFESLANACLTGKGWNVVRPDWDVIRYEVPCKQGPQCRWTVNWLSAWNAGGPISNDFFAANMTGEEAIDRKYRNTLAYMQWFHTRRAETPPAIADDAPPDEPIGGPMRP